MSDKKLKIAIVIVAGLAISYADRGATAVFDTSAMMRDALIGIAATVVYFVVRKLSASGNP